MINNIEYWKIVSQIGRDDYFLLTEVEHRCRVNEIPNCYKIIFIHISLYACMYAVQACKHIYVCVCLSVSLYILCYRLMYLFAFHVICINNDIHTPNWTENIFIMTFCLLCLVWRMRISVCYFSFLSTSKIFSFLFIFVQT